MQTCLGPLGCLHVAGAITESEIIGVVRDMKYDGLRADAVPAIYLSGLQSSVKRRTIAIRTTGSTATLLNGVRQELAAMSPGVALTNIQTMGDVMAGAQSRDRFSALLLTMFGLVAFLLASVGVYGVLSYAVAQRKAEVGVRVALGADRGDVRALVLNDGNEARPHRARARGARGDPSLRPVGDPTLRSRSARAAHLRSGHYDAARRRTRRELRSGVAGDTRRSRNRNEGGVGGGARRRSPHRDPRARSTRVDVPGVSSKTLAGIRPRTPRTGPLCDVTESCCCSDYCTSATSR